MNMGPGQNNLCHPFFILFFIMISFTGPIPAMFITVIVCYDGHCVIKKKSFSCLLIFANLKKYLDLLWYYYAMKEIIIINIICILVSIYAY